MCKEKKIKTKKVRFLIVYIMIFLFLLLNVSISFNPNDNGGCISVTFDKLPLLLAQKVIIRANGKEYEIIDNELVREVIRESVVATNTDLRYIKSTSRSIDVYCGKFLVRKIQWVTGCDPMFIVYTESPLHWIFFSLDGDGIVFPSNELIDKLESIVNAN